MKAALERITPDKAADYLSKNLKNRNISRTNYEPMGDDMLAGRWQVNPNAGIMFDQDGILIDGQHRLTAIGYAAGLNDDFDGVDMWVYRDVPDTVRHVVDIGRIRSLGDILTMEGQVNASVAGAAAQLVLNYADGIAKINQRRSKPEKFDFCIENPTIFQYAALAQSAGRAARHAALAAVLYLGTRSGDLEELAQKFGNGVANGAELSLGDPRLALRGAILNSRGQRGGSASISWAFAATAQAWNGFVMGMEMNAIRALRENDTNDFQIVPILGGPEFGDGVANMNVAVLKDKPKRLAERTLASLESEGVAAE